MTARLTTLQFIEKAVMVHGDKYDYSLVNYHNRRTNVIIICKEHGRFLQTPDSHLSGCECQKCGANVVTYQRLNETVFKFIEKAREIHGDKYDYSKVKYIDSKEKVVIVCREHGDFTQMPNAHLQKRGCPRCGDRNKRKQHTSTTGEFIKRASVTHHGIYDYSLVVYVKGKLKVDIICKKHGVFKQTPNHHLQGDGCPRCRTSKGELNISRFLDENNILFETQKTFPFCKKKRHLPFDFFIPSLNIIIEYQGMQHFSPWKLTGDEVALRKLQERDKYKAQCAVDHGYIFRAYTVYDKWSYIYSDILKTVQYGYMRNSDASAA